MQSSRGGRLVLGMCGLVLLTGGALGTQVPSPAPAQIVRAVPWTVSPTSIPRLSPERVVTSGGPLVLSDNPEEVYRPGITAAAHVTGTFRVCWFFVNVGPRPLYGTLVARALGPRGATVQVLRAGMDVEGAPAAGTGSPVVYQAVAGERAAYRYFLAPRHERVHLPSRGAAFLWPRLNTRPTYYGDVEAGYLLGRSSAPIALYVEVARRPTVDASRLSRLGPSPVSRYGRPPVPRAWVNRGTFPHGERTMVYTVSRLPARILVAADRYHPSAQALDPRLVGWDRTVQAPTVDVGNYGLLYRLVIRLGRQVPQPVGVYVVGGSSLYPLTAVVRTVQPVTQLVDVPPVTGVPAPSGALVAQVPGTAVVELFPPAGSLALTTLVLMPLPSRGGSVPVLLQPEKGQRRLGGAAEPAARPVRDAPPPGLLAAVPESPPPRTGTAPRRNGR